MNPFSRITSKTSQFIISHSQSNIFDANRTGVTSRNDQTNVSLHCSGDMSITGRLHNLETISDNFFRTSDERLKTNIQPIDSENSLEIIKRINPVTFDWKKNNSSNSNETGYIAQEAENIDKRFVRVNDNGMYSMNYDTVSIHTTAALKNVIDRIERLEKLEKNKTSKRDYNDRSQNTT